ncbi:MAG: DUF1134 domain-containing protein [Pseudomonadota bacterium]
MSLKRFAVFFSILFLTNTSLLADDAESNDTQGTYDQDTIISEAEGFFGKGAEGLGEIVEKIFKEHGEPNGYIKGREAGGAFVVGLRYGDGELYLKNGYSQKVHWQGPSIGFDWGGNAAKVFTLVYDLPSVESIFQRFPGVDGSAYFIGGVGVNYLEKDGIILAPMRLGVGWRLGANVGYMKITPEKTWNPF